MKFKYLVDMDVPEGRIYEGTIAELDGKAVAERAGRGFDHLEGMDKAARDFLESLKAPKAEPKGK